MRLIEALTESNLYELTTMSIELWPSGEFDEELEYFSQVIHKENEDCFLVRIGLEYAGFIYLSVRSDYVEGAKTKEVAYIEGIYVREAFKRQGIASILCEHAETWAKQKGLLEIGSDTEIDNLISQSLHSKVGFREVNRVVHYIKSIS